MAIKVDQTRFGAPDGNCMAACIASIFELPLETADEWHATADDWRLALIRWFAKHNIAIIQWGPRDDWTPGGWSILSGQSPRCGHGHAIVAYNGANYHDPHPDREGVTEIWDWTEFYVLDPEQPCPLFDTLQKQPEVVTS